MKKNHTNLFTPSLFTLSIYEIIYAALFKDYQITYQISALDWTLEQNIKEKRIPNLTGTFNVLPRELPELVTIWLSAGYKRSNQPRLGCFAWLPSGKPYST